MARAYEKKTGFLEETAKERSGAMEEGVWGR